MPQDIAGFFLLSLAVMATPGPAVAHVLASTLLGGLRLAGAAALGLALGHCVTISLGLLAGTVLLANPVLLGLGQGAAALVLTLLGLRLLRRGRGVVPGGRAVPRHPALRRPAGGAAAAVGGFVMTLGNPISLAFAVSTAAGFLDPAQPRLPQSLVLGCLYVGAAATVYAAYAIGAAAARGCVLGAVARQGGAMRLAAGLVLLAVAGMVGLRSFRLLAIWA